MAIFPGATPNLIPRWNNGRPRKGRITVAVLHIAVSNARSIRPVFEGGKNGCSHLYIRKDGTAEQYMDSRTRSAAETTDSDRIFSIETEGGVGTDLHQGWTAAQIETLVQVIRWLHETEGLQLRVMQSSRPEEVGVGYHRLGVPRSKWTSKTAPGWLVQGGRTWSKAVGKVCPGDARIAQIGAIVGRAAVEQIIAPTKPPVTSAPPSKTPTKRSVVKVELRVLDWTKQDTRYSEETKQVQGLLAAHGVYPSNLIDGKRGKKSRDGLAAFQRKHKTGGSNGKPDYKIGAGTWRALLSGVR